ncbi:hypothetical protein V8C44DRAFT_319732, partial [Trichoderma aethiopicum]
MLDRSQSDGHSLTRSNILSLSNTSCGTRVTKKRSFKGWKQRIIPTQADITLCQLQQTTFSPTRQARPLTAS